MSPIQHDSGFSAVELLLTLFIAALFLITGHQLYLAVIRDSGSAQQRTRASVLASEYLQRYSAEVPASCAPSERLNTAISPRPEGLASADITVKYSCPGGSTPSTITKVEVTLQYGPTTEEVVTHVAYAKQS